MQAAPQTAVVPSAFIAQRIYFVRSTRVMLDAVATSVLNRAVLRNRQRFPSDFMFQLNGEELRVLRCQSGISKATGRGGRRYAPYVFTEQGIAMLSSVLRSSRAVQVNVAIMRTFVRLREMLATHEELRRKIDAIEKRYDARFHTVFATIRQMLETPIPAKRAIGFHAKVEPLSQSRQLRSRRRK